jgi:superfamily II DNA/RNA helicase
VVDESHHSQAETFAEVINYFKPKYKLGMTATPDREDQADIRDIFGQEVVSLGLPEAIAKGWLTPIDYRLLSDGLDEEKIRAVCKEVLEDNIRLTEKQINEKIFIKIRTEEQCKIVQKFSKTQKAIVFCENLEHLHHVTSILPSSVTIHSEQTAKVNESNFELFKNGYVQHVIVVDKFNEGIDVPDTELLVFLRATNSQRIFLQQLGRGLRLFQGKEKVTVLDFVANIDRIKEVSKLVKEIERIAGNKTKGKKKQIIDAPLHVEGKGFRFDFSDQVVNLVSIFDRLDQDFYPTWQEASKVAISLDIKSYKEYLGRYKEDSRLPSSPHLYYEDFPNWINFLDTGFYSTWEEASKAAIALGIKSYAEYHLRYEEDSKLPSSPNRIYSNFPKWKKFLDSEPYSTWEQASKAAIALGIKSYAEYHLRYKEDPKLQRMLSRYKGFPGINKFFWWRKEEILSNVGRSLQSSYCTGYKILCRIL